MAQVLTSEEANADSAPARRIVCKMNLEEKGFALGFFLENNVADMHRDGLREAV